MARQPAVRVARWSATHPWRAILLWVVFVAVCVVVGGGAGAKKATDRDLAVGESGRATQIMHGGGLDEPKVENVLITARSGSLDRQAAQRIAAEVVQRMRALPQVAGVGEPSLAPKGTAILVPVTMRGDPDSAKSRVAPLLKETAAIQRAHSDVRIEQVGPASVANGLDEQIGKDLGKTEGLSLPVTLLIMMVAFGAIVAAGVPVLLAISAVAASTGLYGLASHIFPDSGTVSSMIMMMGMAVGVDYSLFYLKREREERERGRDRIDAIEIAAATSGHSVVVSAIAVIVSMAGLYLADDVIFSGLATGTIIVVAVAMLGSLTILPALLAKLGRAVDRPRVPLLWRLTSRTGAPRVWPALLRPALRHPLATLLVSVVALLALALPALGMQLKNTGTDELPRTIPVMRSYDRMIAAYPDEHAPHQVAVRAPAERAAEVRGALRKLVERTQRDPLFAHDQTVRGQGPEIRASADGRVHIVSVVSPYDGNSRQAKQGLRELRRELVPATVGTIAHAEYAVGGDTASNLDFGTHVEEKLPLVIGFVLLLTFVMMTVTFRSIVVALTAITVNLLSAMASFGLLVLVFQHTWAERALGFTSTGTVIAWLPLFLFVVLFGLSMDYHVFVVSRIQEAARRGLPTRNAVEYGITRSAGVVTSAAIVMVSVFAVFASLPMMDMKQMGFGLAAAVLIDAVVVRIVILPSLMTLLGRANWWPARMPTGPRAMAGEENERLLDDLRVS
ncbi:MAG: drug exporter-like protein of the superfamily [Actinomycetia bacterium]|nr:drug exporter-like protein of the superfamily [Actinomycetes bacterium]